MVSFYSFGNKWAFKNNKPLIRSSNLISSNTANVDSATWNAGERVTSVGTNGGPSYYGCYDMMGNNWQWTDLYSSPSPIKGSLGLFWGHSGPGSSLKAVMGSAAYWDHKASQAYSTFGVRIASLTNPDSLPNFVLVGDAGNAIDVVRNQWNSMLFGDVAYNYYINKYQLTVSEYVEFLNAVAATDTYNLYKCILKDGSLNPERSILRTGSSGSYSYSIQPNYGNKPVGNLSWFMAARYCNWLHNGKPSGAQNSGTTETGAYTLNGIVSGNAPVKNEGARYSMPSMNEWYKAAYYKGGGTNAGYWRYAIQSDIRPKSVLADQYGNGTTKPSILSPDVSVGANVTTSLVQDNIFNIGVALTYANISTAGVTKIVPVTAAMPNLPANFSLSNNLGKYSITTTSNYSGNIDLCFTVPSTTTLANFNRIKIFHTNSNDITTDVTTTRTFATKTICSRTTGFSSFHVIPETVTVDQPIPSNITGTVGNGIVNLSWSMSDTTDIIDYDIKYSSDGGNSWLNYNQEPSTSLSTTISSLNNNTNYVFIIASVSSNGTSNYSSSSSTFTPVASVPDSPTNLVGVSKPRSVELTWDVPNNNGSTINNYNVQYSTNGGTTWTNSKDTVRVFPDDISLTQTLLIDDLNAGTYIFRVKAINDIGDGSYSNNTSNILVTSFSPSAVILSSGSSYTIPIGTSIMRVWVIGGGGGGQDGDGCDGGDNGGYGGEAYKEYSVTDGSSVSYSIGSAGQGGTGGYGYANSTDGGTTTFTYNGVSITATGGKNGNYRRSNNLSSSDAGGAGTGVGGDFNSYVHPTTSAPYYYPADLQGRNAAILGTYTNYTLEYLGSLLNYAGNGGGGGSGTGANNGGGGAVILYFT